MPKEKSCMCFVDLEKRFDRVPRKVFELALMKKGIPEILVRSAKSLCRLAKTRVREDSELPEELEVKVGMHQGSVLTPFLFVLVVLVVTKFAREGALSQLLYADDLALMSETIEGLRNKFLKWKEVFKSKGLKVKVMVSSGITMDGMSKNKVDPCWVCSLRVKANSALRLKWGEWIHGRCAGVYMETTAENVKGISERHCSLKKHHVMK